MIIHFGLHLDGMQPAPPATEVGVATLGPVRLLDLLELQLGLPHIPARPGEALLAYQTCLKDAEPATRFYGRSFQVDSIGTARALLDWRAAWHEAGWRGAFDGNVSRRLADMAAVEALARTRVPPTPGQRLQRVAAALDSGLATQIERIVLHDEPTALPAAWRKVLDQLDCETAPGVHPPANAAPGSDLHRLQCAFLELSNREDGSPPVEVTLEGDDSVIVVRGVSRDLSAQTLAEYIAKTRAADEIVIIAERDGIIVDNALERVGLPRAGFQHYSRFRAVTQVLKLALGLMWEPVAPRLLLQFLLHPVGPLPGVARSLLAEAVAAEPGVGGRAWNQALARIAERERSRDIERNADSHRVNPREGAREHAQEHRQDASVPAATTDGRGQMSLAFAEPSGSTSALPGESAATSAKAAARAEKLLADIDYWLAPQRYSPTDGAPLDALIDRTQRCTTWLIGRLHAVGGAERDLYAAAQAQGEALMLALATLADRGDTRVARIALEQLVDEVTGNSADPGIFAQAGHVRAATEPATITRPWHTVIWWDLAAQSLRPDTAWSDAELGELSAQGLDLPPPDERIRALGRSWQRPILNARARLMLVVHDREEGHHPLWSQLQSIARNFNEIRIEDELLDNAGEPSIPALDVATEALMLKPLPALRRWWTLPPGCRLAPRDAESYSSLAKLINGPHEWVLTYPARLATGRAANLASGGLLYGNLAHRLFETYFETFPADGDSGWADQDEAAVRRWLAATLPTIIAREGAVLTEPGMGVTREWVGATLENALVQLLRHLKSAGVLRVVAEALHDVPFDGIAAPDGRRLRLKGAIDLMLTDRQGREIVLDVKWGGEEWRGREIASNRALQLATYAYMRHALHGARADAPWPKHAYFIVQTGNVVARDTSVFPDAIDYPPEDGESVEQVWRRLCAAFDWRWSQLAAGHVEVNAAGTHPDARSIPPIEALAAVAEPSKFDEFTWLTGWERGA